METFKAWPPYYYSLSTYRYWATRLNVCSSQKTIQIIQLINCNISSWEGQKEQVIWTFFAMCADDFRTFWLACDIVRTHSAVAFIKLLKFFPTTCFEALKGQFCPWKYLQKAAPLPNINTRMLQNPSIYFSPVKSGNNAHTAKATEHGWFYSKYIRRIFEQNSLEDLSSES